MNLLTTKRIFLIDAFGALVSISIFLLVLLKHETFFGIPKSSIYLLCTVPGFFIIYDLSIYFLIKRDLGFYLKVLAFMNLFYCALSIGVGIYLKGIITRYGHSYLFLEIIVLILLCRYQLFLSRKKSET